MKNTEDAFCALFYQWWRDQTAPQKMTWEKAKKLIADCRSALKANLVPDEMTQETFEEHMETAYKVVLFATAWDVAKTKSMDDLRRERPIPKK